MSFIKKLRLSKRLPSVLSKSLNKQPTMNGALTNEQHNATTTGATLANNTTLNDSIVNSNNNTNNTTLNTTITTSASSKSGGDKRGKSDSRCLVIYHIDSETEGTWSLTVRNDDNGETVLNKVCDYYSLSGYKEYFGLKYTLVDEKGDHEIFWLDPFKLVGKQLKDTNNVLTFRVKHFPGKPQLIESEYVRYLIFLQIRNYLLKGDLQLSLTDEARLSAYAVQAYLGDYDPEVHHDHYLADLKFLPPQKSIKAEETIIELHKELRGKTPADMELAFLEKVSQFDTYGAELIVVKNSKGVEINFGVSHNGIITFLHGMPSSAAKICLYPWTQIGKISYDGRTLKVHAHTPDVKNPEIIKKQVMIFKCNSKRICKHLWKFILDQKAFFNFKRGIDVPKIKSSSSFFSHKSKFRFSGRCENELISSQYESSILNISPLSIATSPNDFNKTSTLPSFRGGSSVGTFKRRTFLNAHRSQAHSPQSINATASTNPTLISPIVEQQTTRGGNNDSNNNNLLLKRVENEENPETATIRDDQTQTSLSKPGSFAQLSINVYSPTGAASNELNLTSTPQPTSDKEMRSTTSGGRDLVREDEHTDSEDEDEFYDHDQVLSSSPSTPTVGVGEIDDLQRQFELYNGNGGKLISYRQQQANCGGDVMKNKQGRRPLICTVIILFGFFCLVLFIITLVQYAHCHVFSASTASCHYSRIVSRLNDNLSALNRRFLTPFKRSSTPYYTGSTSWPIYQYNSTNLLIDPLFSWFFSQYQPH